jgi:hypothetical protein
MKQFRHFERGVAALAFVLMALPLSAQFTVSKNPGDSANFDTIAAALSGTPNDAVITILDNAVYTEPAAGSTITINRRTLIATNGAVLDGNVQINGANPASLQGLTLRPSVAGSNTGIVINATGTVTITNVLVDGTAGQNRFGQDGIRINNPSNTTLTNVTIQHIGTNGILVRNAADGYVLTLNGVTVSNVGAMGLSITRPNGTISGTGLTLTGGAANQDAINWGTATTVNNLQNLSISGGWRDGFTFGGAGSSVTLTGASISGLGRDGIRYGQAGNSVILDHQQYRLWRVDECDRKPDGGGRRDFVQWKRGGAPQQCRHDDLDQRRDAHRQCS